MIERYENESAVAWAERCVAAGDGQRAATFRQQFTTYGLMGGHPMAETLLHMARVHGLMAELDSGRGWLSRSHLITVVGPVESILRWWRWCEKQQRSM